MRRIEATYKIITPMFISGANQNICDLRSPSFKGVLRFWYRAIALPYYNNNWIKVKEQENKLFGSTSRKSKVSITINHRISEDELYYKINNKIGTGLSYLGYGCFKTKNGKRNSIQPNTSFTVVLSLNSAVTDEEKDLMIKSLQAIGLFGGMGSRVRNGFGSVNLVSLQDDRGKIKWHTPKNIIELKKTISELLGGMKLSSELPEYTAFCKHSVIRIIRPSKDYKEALDLLNEIGEEMIKFRSYGKNGRLPGLNVKSERNFRKDHDLIYDFIDKGCIDNHPNRVVFGLPQNYSVHTQGTNYSIKVTPENTGRRASPLFIHIHEINKDYYGIITFLPAKFLPSGEKITIQKFREKKRVESKKVESRITRIEDFQPLVDFMNRFRKNEVFRIENNSI